MRREITFTATQGRDKGKVFQITEMSATDAEDWALKVVFALMNAGADIPENLEEMGFSGVISVGIGALGKIPYQVGKPILDDLLECVKAVPDIKKPNVTRRMVDEDIEEVLTRIQLRKAVFDLHVEALKPDAL